MTPDDVDRIMRRLDGMEEMRAAFMDKPAGAPKNARSLLETLHVMAALYNRSRWLATGLIWGLPAVAGVVIAWDAIRTRIAGAFQ